MKMAKLKHRRKGSALTPAHPHDRSTTRRWRRGPLQAPGVPGLQGRPWGRVQVVAGLPAGPEPRLRPLRPLPRGTPSVSSQPRFSVTYY